MEREVEKLTNEKYRLKEINMETAELKWAQHEKSE